MRNMRAIFGFSGITDITFINVQPLDYSPEVAAASMEQATKSAETIASNFYKPDPISLSPVPFAGK
jgi:FMN-dependent NADH-azoreductase